MITMMNINEYFDNLFANARDDEEFDEILEIERVMYHVWEENELDFENWAHEEGIDLTARRVVGNSEELELTLWAWDVEEIEEY